MAILTLLLVLAVPAALNAAVQVTIEGAAVDFANAPVVIDGRTLVPVRPVFEALGFYVSWIEQRQTVLISRDDSQIMIAIGSEVFYINRVGRSLDVPAKIIDGSTMVPIRPLLEAVGYAVSWLDGTVAVNGSAFEHELLAAVNTERAARGLGPLAWSRDLAKISRMRLDSGIRDWTQSLAVTFAGTFIDRYISPEHALERIMRSTANQDQIFNSQATSIGIALVKEPHESGLPLLRFNLFLAAGPDAASIANPLNIHNMEIAGTLPISLINLPNRRATELERRLWISEYLAMGGVSGFELEVIRLINRVRVSYGLSILTLDMQLSMAARFYTQLQSNLNLMNGHNQGPYATDPASRHGASANVAAAFGGNLRWGGGNAYAGPTTPQRVVDGWMASPGHRAYILSPEHNFIGMGTTPGGRWGVFHYLFLSEYPSS